jgi:hypothetical protein
MLYSMMGNILPDTESLLDFAAGILARGVGTLNNYLAMSRGTRAGRCLWRDYYDDITSARRSGRYNIMGDIQGETVQGPVLDGFSIIFRSCSSS